jgi:hypothetical protein
VGADPLDAVWIDRSALTIETTIDGTHAVRGAPDRDDAISHLAEGGRRVGLIGDVDTGTTGLPEGARGWLLTSNAGQARAVRHQGGVRTVLIGPATADRRLANRAADHDARGLLEAVLIVLAADAMPDEDAVATG